MAGSGRAERIRGWQTLIAGTPPALLFCWRGGLRSQTAADWLSTAGTPVEPLHGGYQAVRRRCLTLLEQFPRRASLRLIGGRTGCGKTRVLSAISNAIDLEGIARHRGSAFGQWTANQPPPASFENELAAATLGCRLHSAVTLEDESRTIGRLALPANWFQAMQQAPIVQLEATLPERIEHIADEYVREPLAAGQSAEELENRYLAALNRISKRLGLTRHRSIAAAVRQGFAQNDHGPWIEQLLAGYYDPSYDYQLQQKAARIVFRGAAAEVLAYCAEHESTENLPHRF